MFVIYEALYVLVFSKKLTKSQLLADMYAFITDHLSYLGKQSKTYSNMMTHLALRGIYKHNLSN